MELSRGNGGGRTGNSRNSVDQELVNDLSVGQPLELLNIDVGGELLAEHLGVSAAGAKDDPVPHVPQHPTADISGNLIEVLVNQGEVQVVLARLS